MPYENLVKRLRDISNSDSNIKSNYIGLTTLQAADAIEELQKQVEDYECRLEISPEAEYAIDKHCDDIISRMDKLIKGLDDKPRWIPVTERLPEESEGLNWYEDMMIRFTSVWCCDAKTGTLEVRNRLQRKMIWNDCLDHYTKDTAWHWSKSWWEPTHWMPIVPLPTPLQEEI